MAPMDSLPREIAQHYLEGREAERLRAGTGELEFLRTQVILAAALPAPPAVVLDVGGGAGVHAIPLAAKGYAIHLIDPVALHVEQSRAAAAKAGVTLASAALGDARRLTQDSGAADAVLLLGPLYHLTEREDRVTALREAHRVLKPGGVVCAAGISRFASLIDGVAKGFFADEVFRGIVEGDLESGQHRNPGNHPRYFTTAFFHRPEELAGEARDAGFPDPEILAVEGPVWSAAGFGDAWDTPVQRSALMKFLSAIEREPSIVGASAHFILTARRPGEER